MKTDPGRAGRMGRPVRRHLWHTPPNWVPDGAMFFVTGCCARRGPNQLCVPRAFRVMTDALAWYVDRERCWVEVWLAMPDHWHALMAFPTEERMADVVRDWKRYVAREAGVTWQDGFFDHRLRGGEGLTAKWAYIADNPVRKGLCARPEDWPWVWRPGIGRSGTQEPA